MNQPLFPSIAETLNQETLLRAENVVVSFDGFKAIQDLNFEMKKGELRFLIGPNGAGKTTFMDVICGKIKPQSGKVFFLDNIEVTRLQEHRIARLGIGRKFQAPSVFINLSVQENLELAMKQPRSIYATIRARLSNEQRQLLESRLELINLMDRARELAGSLSHGEKQWLEIGMLLMQEPDLLLLDEPVAGMTDQETEKTGELLHIINREQSILIVEHDMDFVRTFAKTVTVMHEGRVLREGTMEEVQNDEMVAEVYLGRKVAVDA
jgi:urea transport system ATP-binding protein